MHLESLKGDRAFQRLRRGQGGSSKYLSLRWRPNNDQVVRIGLVVSKKVGNAVVRNRVRRRLRESMRAILSKAAFQPKALHAGRASFTIVLIARVEAAQADYWSLKAALLTAMTRASLLEPISS